MERTMEPTQQDWMTLLIGGPSGVGKSTVGKHIGARLGVPWLQVDDLRLALQESRVALPTAAETTALYFFEETPSVLDLPETRLRDGLIALGQVLSPAIEKVISNHVAIVEPIVIEGDAILPSLSVRPGLRTYAATGLVRAIFLVEKEEEAILTNLQTRGRGIDMCTEADLRTQARLYWLYGQWLASEAHRYGLPVIEPQPWDSLIDRVTDGIATALLP
jgi:2-phosphoglycerate kinase